MVGDKELLNYLYENIEMGIVALEAIAAKRPVVATNAGGLPEVADKRFCVLCEPSPTTLRYAIESVVKENYRFDFSEVEDYLQGFTIGRMVDNYLALI